MAVITITEKDFIALATAANYALENGDSDSAKTLDRLARKTNLALSSKDVKPFSSIGGSWSSRRCNLTWRDMPSTLQKDATLHEHEKL